MRNLESNQILSHLHIVYSIYIHDWRDSGVQNTAIQGGTRNSATPRKKGTARKRKKTAKHSQKYGFGSLPHPAQQLCDQRLPSFLSYLAPLPRGKFLVANV